MRLAIFATLSHSTDLPAVLTMPSRREEFLRECQILASFHACALAIKKITVDCQPSQEICLMQGGPGCAGHFGNYYELGPEWVTPNLKLIPNPGAWNRGAGLIFIDQPVGTGFSPSGKTV